MNVSIVTVIISQLDNSPQYATVMRLRIDITMPAPIHIPTDIASGCLFITYICVSIMYINFNSNVCACTRIYMYIHMNILNPVVIDKHIFEYISKYI
jgi:hypothetical protein